MTRSYSQQDMDQILGAIELLKKECYSSATKNKVADIVDRITLSLGERLGLILEDLDTFTRLEQRDIDLLKEIHLTLCPRIEEPLPIDTLDTEAFLDAACEFPTPGELDITINPESAVDEIAF